MAVKTEYMCVCVCVCVCAEFIIRQKMSTVWVFFNHLILL